MRERVWVAGVLAGLTALVGLAFVILGPGRFDPSPPSLSGNLVAGLEGEIAFSDSDGCVVVVTLGTAEERELACPGQLAQVWWEDAETVAYTTYFDRNAESHLIDAATGEPKGTSVFRQDNYDRFWVGPTGARLVVEWDDGTVLVEEDGERLEIYKAGYPEHHGPQPSGWSPDGAWVLMSYYGPHSDDADLWLIATDGSVARTLASDFSGGPPGASWRTGEEIWP